MSGFKGKKRTDKVSERLYYKDFDSLVKSYSKINALATALNEAEFEIERLVNELKTSKEQSLNLDSAVQKSELLIGLLTMLEKEGGNDFIDKAAIVAEYQANL